MMTKTLGKQRALGIVLSLGIGAGLFSACHSGSHSQYTELSGEVFHTYFHIKYDLDRDYSREVDSTFGSFSHSLNSFDSTSLISAINRNESSQTDSMLRYVWRAATQISVATDGSYDVSVAPLSNVWGFGLNRKLDTLVAPSAEQIDSILQFVGYTKARLEGEQLVKDDPRMRFDLSSICKGYCSDLVGHMLESKGVSSYMVELGGEIAFKGRNPQGEPWTIGITKPVYDNSGLQQELEIRLRLERASGGIATSGNYRNYKVIDGRKYGHTIDPHTGCPIQTDVLSATVLAPNCMLADGLATACMAIGSERVPELMKRFPTAEYMLILGDERGQLRTEMSPGFEHLVLDAQ